MTLRYLAPAQLAFGDLVRVNGEVVSVQAIEEGALFYHGVRYAVVYVLGMTEARRNPALFTVPARQELVTAR
jgi:hypothetical protein